jgi:GT2 family glycosyltransferase
VYESGLSRKISVVIPAYGAAERLSVCLESLARYGPHDCTITVLDDATPDDSVRATCENLQPKLPNFRYLRSAENRGFVATCNWGAVEARDSGSDLLLLNSDTEVTSGFLSEMQAVLDLHERHAVVTPRSNNATIFSIPFCGQRIEAAESFQVWQKIRSLLPRYTVMPTVVGFCMLIKSEVLDRFDLFDEIYSPGYNEENDFVCRINRCGYSAVSANWAYVFHHESASFGIRQAELDQKNRKTLFERYPEYTRRVEEYVRFQADPIEYFADLYRPHRPRVLYDLFHLDHLQVKHCGTSEFALNLLCAINQFVGDEWDLYVGIGEALSFFSADLRGYRIYRDQHQSGMPFDLVYMPCQLPDWKEFHRMNRLAPRVAYTLLDIIAVRCGYLGGISRDVLTRKTAELADTVFAISDFSRTDFSAFFGIDAPMKVIHLGTNTLYTPEFGDGEYVLVVGNAFAHKGVDEALKHLDDTWPIIVLGGGANGTQRESHIRRLESGNLSRQSVRELFAKARLVVYPSYYEGFGLPVADALALGKPVVLLDTAVNREIERVAQSRNLHRIQTLKQLNETVSTLLKSTAEPPETPFRNWRAVGEEYVQSFRGMLSQGVDACKLRARWEFLRNRELMGCR